MFQLTMKAVGKGERETGRETERERKSDWTDQSTTKALDHSSKRGCHLVDAQQGGVEVYLRGEGAVMAQHPTELIQSDLAATGNVSQVSCGFTTGI